MGEVVPGPLAAGVNDSFETVEYLPPFPICPKAEADPPVSEVVPDTKLRDASAPAAAIYALNVRTRISCVISPPPHPEIPISAVVANNLNTLNKFDSSIMDGRTSFHACLLPSTTNHPPSTSS